MEVDLKKMVAQFRRLGKPNIVCCHVSVRFYTWAEVHARTDTLVRQPPYLVTRGWVEVVPGRLVNQY